MFWYSNDIGNNIFMVISLFLNNEIKGNIRNLINMILVISFNCKAKKIDKQLIVDWTLGAYLCVVIK